MHRFNRSDRVSNLIHREISNIIEYEMKDTHIGMVTVTGVEMSRDLKNAKVFFSVLGDQSVVESNVEALNNAVNFIRSRLRERVILKRIPNLMFAFDSSTLHGLYIDKLFDEINKQKP
ncbi:MAG: 30S ribosome-binding factor RbfA [Candidatus Latescibacterota bacterium]|jgi:ribosome-binding factor A